MSIVPRVAFPNSNKVVRVRPSTIYTVGHAKGYCSQRRERVHGSPGATAHADRHARRLLLPTRRSPLGGLIRELAAVHTLLEVWYHMSMYILFTVRRGGLKCQLMTDVSQVMREKT